MLCDVPCSGFGVLKENPDILLRASERDFASLIALQSSILSVSARYVKPGGYLYYSTCTLFREENDEIIGAFIKSHPEFTVEESSSPLPHKKMKHGVQFLPHLAFGAGFYFCKMKRNV